MGEKEEIWSDQALINRRFGACHAKTAFFATNGSLSARHGFIDAPV
jgi:hypothetical protein